MMQGSRVDNLRHALDQLPQFGVEVGAAVKLVICIVAATPCPISGALCSELWVSHG